MENITKNSLIPAGSPGTSGAFMERLKQKGALQDFPKLQGFTAFSKAPGIYGAYFICGGDFMLQCEKCQCEKFYLTNRNNILACQRCLYPVHPLRYMEHFRREMKKVVRVYG